MDQSPENAQRALWKKAKHASVLLTPRLPIHDNRHRHPISQDGSEIPLLSHQTNDAAELHVQSNYNSLNNNLLHSHFQPNNADLLMSDIVQSSWRHRLAFYLDTSSLSRVWELVDLLINFVFVALYIYNTTYDEQGLPAIPRILDVVLALLLLLQYTPHLLIDVDQYRAWLSALSVLTFLSTVPVIAAFWDLNALVQKSYMSAGLLAYAYPFRFVRLHIVLMACLVPSKTSILKFSLITRKSIRLIAFLLFLVLTVASFVHLVAFKSHGVKNLTFFDSFYFAIVSVTSGTTTQIVPDGLFSRIVILYILITAAVFIPTRLAELLSLMSKKSYYDHSFKYRKSQNHVVVCGEFELSSISTFLKEFFCADHGPVTVNTHVVILNPGEPSEDLKLILEDPVYVNRVQYVKGSVMSMRSLEKVRIKDAKACFVFSSKFTTENAAEDDAKTVMRALALKKNVKGIKLHVQVLLPEHKCHFDYLADTMVCIDELKLGMLAQNCRCPGFTTMMHILTTSLTEKAAEKLMLRSILKDQSNECSWLNEYIGGASQEIYPITMTHAWKGRQFCELSYAVYREYGAVIFAIGIPNSSYKQKVKQRRYIEEHEIFLDETILESLQINAADFDLFVNPGDYTLQGDELCFYVGANQMVFNSKPLLLSKKQNKSIFKQEHVQVDMKDILVNQQPEDAENRQEMATVTPTEGSVLGTSINPSRITQDALPEMLFDPVDSLNANNEVADSLSPLSQSQESVPLKGDGKSKGKGASARHKLPTQESKDGLVTRILNQAIGLSTGAFQQSAPLFSATEARPLSQSESMVSFDSKHPLILPNSVSGHILVCDPNGSPNIEFFLAPLRSAHLQSNSGYYTTFRKNGTWTPIVILTPVIPNTQQLRLIEKFDEVYIIQGSPIVRADLHRAGVDRCLKAVILANSSKGKNETERTADANSLLSVLNIEAMGHEEDLFIVTEFIHYENMNFIGESAVPWSKSTVEYSRTLMRPSFMAGHVYSQNMLDSVICQNFYNPHMLNILRHIIFSGTFHLQNQIKQLGEPIHSHIWLVSLPSVVRGTRYCELFQYLASEHQAIPIGLYRQVPLPSDYHHVTPISPAMPDLNMKPTNRSFLGFKKGQNNDGGNKQLHTLNRHHYVCVNPTPDTVLRADDKVYVFSNERPVMTQQ